MTGTKSPDGMGCWRNLYPFGFFSELRAMCILIVPIVLNVASQVMVNITSLMFCGHILDPNTFDGVCMAVSVIVVSCISVSQGLGSACDTFFSQSYGSTNKKNMGIVLQRAMFIFLLATVPIIVIHLNIEWILLALGQDPIVSKVTGDYMLIFIPGTLSIFMSTLLSKYLQNQNIAVPSMIIGFVAILVNCVLHYIFLVQLKLGMWGSAVAEALAYGMTLALTLGYILLSRATTNTWGGWTSESLDGWGKFLQLAIPGMLMMCMEWWAFEISIFLAGLLGSVELGAQSILVQLNTLWFQIPFGVMIATSIRVGQNLGANESERARNSANVGLTFAAFLGLIPFISFSVLNHQWPKLFTEDKAHADLVASLLLYVGLYLALDGIATVCKGVLYGTGRQAIGAIVIFVSYYVLAIPTASVLMFVFDFGNKGYWITMSINLTLQLTTFLFVVFRTDWQNQAEKAAQRVGSKKEEKDVEVSGSETEFLILLPDQDRLKSRFRQKIAVVLFMSAVLLIGVLTRLNTHLEDPFDVSDKNVTSSGFKFDTDQSSQSVDVDLKYMDTWEQNTNGDTWEQNANPDTWRQNANRTWW